MKKRKAEQDDEISSWSVPKETSYAAAFLSVFICHGGQSVV
ncbi:MAG: hypothetical protein ACLTGN_08115 [Clostridium sp.]|jgi:hypothetical protein